MSSALVKPGSRLVVVVDAMTEPVVNSGTSVLVMGPKGAADALKDADQLQRHVRSFLKKANRIHKDYEKGRLGLDDANAALWDAFASLEVKTEGLV